MSTRIIAPLLFAIATFATARSSAETVHVDRNVKYQTIEGFGFFGGRDVWWDGAPDLISPDWARAVIDDLGMSMWRNEYYPPTDSSKNQDADWTKQKPVVTALRDQAIKSRVPLKFIVTVWSPPSSMKCASDSSNVRGDRPHPSGTVNGGAVCPDKRVDFSNWLNEGLKAYADIGIDVYALSFQNEPLFAQGYNSGVYPPDFYAATLADIGPRIHASYPSVKLFGSENMLAIECGKNETVFDPYWYTAHILSLPGALAQIGAFAVHGYSDGVLATPTSKMAQLWTNFYDGVKATEKPVWMTETSGYVDAWEGGPNANGKQLPGAMDLAEAIFSALYYGKAAAWIWWQGSQLDSLSEENLMRGNAVGKRYHVSKHFYRFLRPGARMVETKSDDGEVLAVAFEHPGIGNFVTILINGAHSSKTVSIQGTDVPPQMNAYRTSASESFAHLLPVSSKAVSLSPRSITTLISGSFYDVGGASAPADEPPASVAATGGNPRQEATSPEKPTALRNTPQGDGCGCHNARSSATTISLTLVGVAISMTRRRRSKRPKGRRRPR